MCSRITRSLPGHWPSVQTFLPYPDFRASAEVLDRKRLGKQRAECLQVLRGLTVPTYGWRHHPAVKMWRGYEEALGRYTFTVCDVWVAGGGADTVAETMATELAELGLRLVRQQPALADAGALPPWLGDEALHRSHQSALVRKDPELYGPRFPGVPGDLPYVWPVTDVPAPSA